VFYNKLKMKRTGPTNPELAKLIVELKIASIKNESKIWKRVATELEKPTRQRRHVNLQDINKNSNDGETVLIPGKVLATGELTKQIKVAAWQFSASATEKLKDTISISQLMKDNPKGSKIRLLC
jgi:large subunit ribosomal protein L18e